MNVPTNFAELLIWLGTPAAIMMVLSWLAENSSAFQKASRGWKVFTFVAVPVGLAVLSYILSAERVIAFLSQYDPLLQGIVFALSGVIGSQLWHKYINGSAEEEKPPTPGTPGPIEFLTRPPQG